MKAILRILCIGSLFVFCSKDQAASTNSLRMTAELQDGSRVVGKSLDEEFQFHSGVLGEIKLPLDEISSIECLPETNSVKLTTTNGDILTVSFAMKEIHVETSFGSIKLPVNSIRRIQVLAAGMAGGTKAGLVALWSGEGNANDSIGGCNGELVNGVGFAPGKVGQAFDLNENLNDNFQLRGGFSGPGVFSGERLNRGGGYVLIPASPALDVGKGGGFTFECWIKPSIVTAEMVLLEYERDLGSFNGSDVGVNFAIHSAGSGGFLYANLTDNTGSSHELTTSPGYLNPGVWQHISLTYDENSGKAVIYINGMVAAESSFGKFIPQTSFQYLLLGARTTFNSQTRPGDLYTGGLDEFGIYNRALSAGEIQAVCTEENGGQPLPPPVAIPR